MPQLLNEMKGLSEASRAKASREFLKKVTKGNLEGIQLVAKPTVGKMYHFVYDAKTKDILPYWDKNPLIIVIDRDKNGFLGLNLHYLAPKIRLMLLQKLYDFASNDKFDVTTKLRLSWKLLKSSSRYKQVKPTVKRYLYSHVRSKLALIQASDWEKAVFLPTARFVGASKRSVWSKSRAMF